MNPSSLSLRIFGAFFLEASLCFISVLLCCLCCSCGSRSIQAAAGLEMPETEQQVPLVFSAAGLSAPPPALRSLTHPDLDSVCGRGAGRETIVGL